MTSINEDKARTVEAAIRSRLSVRRFLDTPIAAEEVTALLDLAARAPSGTNMQPWRVYVVAGEKKSALEQALITAHRDHAGDHTTENPYYPTPMLEPYLSRRRAVGWGLYGLLGIARGETEKMHKQHARNFLFFDAPVGLIFTIDRALEIGSWLDYGMFLQNILLAARERGFHTCPQVAFAQFHKIIRSELGIPESEIVICGMSLGHIDPAAPENQLVTEREPASAFATFMGF